MTPSSIFSSLVVHLWQTTLFVAAVWFAVNTVLRRLPSRVRFGLWMSASLKFVIPFSALAAAGATLASPFARQGAESGPVSALVQFVAGPASVARLTEPAAAVAAAEQVAPLFLLLAVWLTGSAAVLARRYAEWIRVVRMVRRAHWILKRDGVDVLESAALYDAGYEPGVFGVFNPVVLVPAGMARHLTPQQLDAVLAHECCHVHRHDNLTGAVHTLVEALFWFHPMVWWLGHHLRRERERACDDAVLRRGVDAAAYAEGILRICRFYVELRLTTVAAVTGADLRRRIERIMTGAVEPPVTALHRLALGAAVILLVLLPIAHGVIVRAQQSNTAVSIRMDATEAFEVASVKANRLGDGQRGIGFQQGGRFRARNMTVRGIVAAAYGAPQPLPLFRVVGGVGWIDSERYDVDAAASSDAAGALTPPWPSRGQSMLRALLIDRFKLVARQELRDLPAYALTVAKTPAGLGPQLRVSTGADCVDPASENTSAPSSAPQISCGGFGVTPPERLSGRYLTMDQLARFLSLNVVERPVINRTGLTGSYSWEIDYNRGLTAAQAGAGEPPVTTGTSIFTALTEQLGLKLEPITAPLDVVVIDSISRPTAD